MKKRPLRAWNQMIHAATKDGFFSQSLHLYSSMLSSGVHGDRFTFPFVAKSCGKLGSVGGAKKIHAHAIVEGFQADVFVQTSLMDMYSKCSSLGDSRKVFDEMPQRSVVSWNSMISGYCKHHEIGEAFRVFGRMRSVGVDPNSSTISSVLSGCTGVEQGSSVHCFATKLGFLSDTQLLNSLVSSYVGFESIEAARSLFDSAAERSTVTWTVMMGGYVQVGDYAQVLKLFNQMREENIGLDAVAILNLMSGCSLSGICCSGCMVHSLLIKSGIGLRHEGNVAASSLVNLYAKLDDISSARKVFDSVPEKNVSLWTSMISGYLQSGSGFEALALSEELLNQEAKVKPNEATIVAILSACADTGSSIIGEKAEEYANANWFESDMKVATSLLRMYCRVGNIDKAKEIFDRAITKDLVFWSTMIKGYACNGKGDEALSLFKLMQKEGGIVPDAIVFTDVLCACNHSGSVEEGLKCFNSMQEEYGIEPSWEHYLCIVDLLARAGHFKSAISIARNAPAQARDRVRTSLLRACIDRRDIMLEELVRERLFDSKAGSTEEHVLSANIYASLEKWREASESRNRIEKNGLIKICGWSRIDFSD